ncbi:hypothetical protein CLCR_09281 [Cladophialophora carrionii]|uniref:Uncharacterized protein n=1 Tax=Cladophialophora carrionii TaxID=86049 RepID=A0A1C1CT33_9EURO|nr:hypothetical protein CLCR_09281 [Cladophialophora carrionii]
MEPADDKVQSDQFQESGDCGETGMTLGDLVERAQQRPFPSLLEVLGQTQVAATNLRHALTGVCLRAAVARQTSTLASELTRGVDLQWSWPKQTSQPSRDLANWMYVKCRAPDSREDEKMEKNSR